MILSWIILAISCILIGICLTLLVQFYLLRLYFYRQEESSPKDSTDTNAHPFEIPKVLLDAIRSQQPATKESCTAVNILLQFLFHELRDTERVRIWFRNKLSLEFEELLKRTAIGRVFGSIKIRDINLGSEFPIINSAVVQDVQINTELLHIDSLDLKLDVNYKGGFQLVIDASMMLGKAACLSVKVVELYGEGRLQFTRLPYSHWSFTFYSEPKLQLEVESQFQGRPLPQITAVISSQIRKALKRKHTLPNFKLRYKPFFTVAEDSLSAEPVLPGHLQLVLHHVSRLTDACAPDCSVYCVAAVDSVPWVEVVSYRGVSYYVLDLVVTKKSSQQLGVSFKQDLIEDRGQPCVVVETVTPGSPAALGEVERGDVVLSVDGKRVSSLGHAPKLIRAAAVQFTLRVERRAQPAPRDELPAAAAVSATVSAAVSATVTGLRRRRRPSGTETESSGSSPAPSAPGSPAKCRSRGGSPEHKEHQGQKEHKERPAEAEGEGLEGEDPDRDRGVSLVRTKALPSTQVVVFEESFSLPVARPDRYLNLGVRCRADSRDFLAGHLNLPLSRVLQSSDRLHRLTLRPPDTFAASNSRGHKLSAHNGFIPELCYGDVLLTARLHSAPGAAPPPSPVAPAAPPLPAVPASESSSASSSRPPSGERRHYFVRTHFQRSTQCEFCGKKIWMKDAVRCRDCGMTCHKKCVERCQHSTTCTPRAHVDGDGSPRRHSDATPAGSAEDGGRRNSAQPEIITTTADEVGGGGRAATPRKGLGSLLASVAHVASAGRGLKRVGSANSLALPGGGGPGGAQSRSLPPSPQQTPTPSRKSSLSDLSEDITTLLQGLVDASGGTTDLMDVAKASGKTLFDDLGLPERKTKIHEMMDKLNAALDSESETRSLLARDEDGSRDSAQRMRTALLIGKSDENMQKLAVLMLHFCAGLQHIQDLEEQEKEAEASSSPAHSPE